MKNRTVLARLAALGVSIMLCFGVVACGEEEESSRGTRSESEKEEDEDKEEDDKKEESEEKEETEEKEEATEEKEAADDNSKEADAPKEDVVVETHVDDGVREGHYVATIDLGEEYFMEAMDTSGVEGMSDLFKGADFTFSATLDLNEDGSGKMAFDMEEFYSHMAEFVDANFEEIMKAAFTSMGVTDEQLEDMLKEEGYASLEDALAEMKEEAMKEFDDAMRDGGGNSEDYEAELTWKEDGSKLILTHAESGNDLELEIGNDGGLSMTLSEEDSPTNQELELVFYKK